MMEWDKNMATPYSCLSLDKNKNTVKTTKLSKLTPLPAYKMAAASLSIRTLLHFLHLLDKNY